MAEMGRMVREGTLQAGISGNIIGNLCFDTSESFARPMRELISNAYDAGATEVKISLDLKADPTTVTVRDNGVGMSLNDIEGRLLRIGQVTRLTEDLDELGRRRIGQFGLGFLSAMPYCDRVRVISKKRGEDGVIEITVKTDHFFKGETFDLVDERVNYRISRSDLSEENGETIIILDGIKPHIVKELRKKPRHGRNKSLEPLEGFDKFKWNICQIAPIQYPEDREDLIQFFKYPGRNPIRVWLDKEELFRNVPQNSIILDKGEVQDGPVRLRYVIMSPLKPVQPQESRGLQVRMRDIGIGSPTYFGAEEVKGKNLRKLSRISGEIHDIQGRRAAKIDSDSRSDSEDLRDVKEFFKGKLNEVVGKLDIDPRRT